MAYEFVTRCGHTLADEEIEKLKKMGTQDVTFRCGHTLTLKICCDHYRYVGADDCAVIVDAKLAWLKERECPTCLAKDSDLVGSKKQVAWAEEIRLRKMLELLEVEVLVRIYGQRLDEEGSEEMKTVHEKMRAAIEAIKAERSAAWWIENRHKTFGLDFVKEAGGVF